LEKKECEAFLVSFGMDGCSPTATAKLIADFPGVQWIQSAAPCSQVDARTVNASISLLAATFGFQSLEYQEKAMQLFTQAIAPILKSNTSSNGATGSSSGSASLAMFSTEEDKRKKERKNFAMAKVVMASLSAIVCSLPWVPGEPLVTVWGQVLVERLFELLSHGNTGDRLFLR
jgi:hypothetical protein